MVDRIQVLELGVRNEVDRANRPIVMDQLGKHKGPNTIRFNLRRVQREARHVRLLPCYRWNPYVYLVTS